MDILRDDRTAIAAVAVLVVGAAALASAADRAALPWWRGGWLLLALAVVALWWRHTRPVLVLVVTAVATGLYYSLGFAGGPEPVPFVIALYAAAAGSHRLAAFLAVPGALAIVELVVWSRGEPVLDPGETVAVVATLAVVVALGELARAREARLHEAAERAALAERLRIARELHDALAHQLSVISVQAGAALTRQDSEVLRVIRDASKQAMRDLRATLGALRCGAPMEPAGRLSAIEQLAAPVRAAGIDVRIELPESLSVPVPVEQAAYRIVQESLTNALRHSGASTVDVRLGMDERMVLISVIDDGSGKPGKAGNGLRGMRERATAIGGNLSAGPRPEGGFAVTARIPT